MYEKVIDELLTLIVNSRFLNGYSRGFSTEDREELNLFLTELKKAAKRLQVQVDVGELLDCKGEESEAQMLLDIINRELTARNLKKVHAKAIDISTALQKWGESLDRRAIIVFQCFDDPFSEKEKNILRSLRKTIRDAEELSGHLGVLTLSSRPVSKWVLLPESNLDERCLEIFELK